MNHQSVVFNPGDSQQALKVFLGLEGSKTSKEPKRVFGNELVVLILVENWRIRWVKFIDKDIHISLNKA
jgi:hypothetical protein